MSFKFTLERGKEFYMQASDPQADCSTGVAPQQQPEQGSVDNHIVPMGLCSLKHAFICRSECTARNIPL